MGIIWGLYTITRESPVSLYTISGDHLWLYTISENQWGSPVAVHHQWGSSKAVHHQWWSSVDEHHTGNHHHHRESSVAEHHQWGSPVAVQQYHLWHQWGLLCLNTISGDHLLLYTISGDHLWLYTISLSLYITGNPLLMDTITSYHHHLSLSENIWCIPPSTGINLSLSIIHMVQLQLSIFAWRFIYCSSWLQGGICGQPISPGIICSCSQLLEIGVAHQRSSCASNNQQGLCLNHHH